MKIEDRNEAIKYVLFLQALGISNDEIINKYEINKSLVADSIFYTIYEGNIRLKSEVKLEEELECATYAKHGKPKFEKFIINGKEYVDLTEVFGSSEWDED